MAPSRSSAFSITTASRPTASRRRSQQERAGQLAARMGRMSDPERNKQLLREQREASQRRALPSALPGAPPFELQNPLSGYMPPTVMVSTDPPSPDPAQFEAAAKG